MQPRISMITLGVRDLATSIKFYEDGLGFPRMDSPPEVAFFTLNGTWLGLYGRDALADDATGSPDGIDFPGFALAHNVSSELEVNRIINEAVAAGATLVKSCQFFLGWILWLLQRSRWISLGGCAQSTFLDWSPQNQRITPR